MLVGVPEHVLALLHQDVILFEQPVRARRIARRNVRRDIVAQKERIHTGGFDGNDYWIWEAVTASSPRVLIMEYNSMFGPDRSVTIPYDPQFDRHRHHSMYYGASLTALTRLNTRKGYRLVAVEPAGVNAFFLRHDVAPHVPACDPVRAYRLLEKYDVLMQKGEDVFRYADEHALELVEIT